MPVEPSLPTKLVVATLPIQIVVYFLFYGFYWLFPELFPDGTIIVVLGIPLLLIGTLKLGAYLESLDVKKHLEQSIRKS